jgi:hypothetical protein
MAAMSDKIMKKRFLLSFPGLRLVDPGLNSTSAR